MVPPSSCGSPPLPLGRAARAKVSRALRLPPSCFNRVSGTAATQESGYAMCVPTVQVVQGYLCGQANNPCLYGKYQLIAAKQR